MTCSSQRFICFLLCLCTGASALAQSPFTVDTTKREDVRTFYRTLYCASENVEPAWSGHTKKGDAGATVAAFREAIELRVNYFRAMAGVFGGVQFDPEYNRKAQLAALMMSANRTLSHAPPAQWRFYTAAGAEAAANSNLGLGTIGPAAVDGYMEDYGAGNTAVGHRRWLLYPQTRTMGSGDVPKSGKFPATNALWIADQNLLRPRPATREEFVAWPPPGYVPFNLVYPRWSFSYPGANFQNATVSMTRNGAQVPVTIERRTDGFGEPTLVWAPDNLNTERQQKTPAPPQADITTTVRVSNVVIGGVSQTFQYNVTIFDPQQPGPDTVLPQISGPVQVAAALGGVFQFAPAPGATGYQVRSSVLASATITEGAENGLDQIRFIGASEKTILSKKLRASGQSAFHLTNANFETQSFLLAREVLLGAASELRFESRLRAATSAQSARVQLSIDGGMTWMDLYQQTGSGSRGENGFSKRTIPLGAFAGKTGLVRFIYTAEAGKPAFVQKGPPFGWYVDDITLANVSEFTSPTVQNLTAGEQQFVSGPAAPGKYALQVRPQFHGRFHLDWGPVFEIEALAVP